MKQLIALLICSYLFISCKQIAKTVEETFHPKDTLIPKKPSSATPVKQHTEIRIDTSFSVTIETHTTTHTHQHKEGKKVNFITNESSLSKAEEALKKLPQYAGKEIFIYSSAHFYDDGSIHMMLQHPDNPKYIDKYEYRNGAWAAPKPEQVSVRNHIESKLIPLNTFKFIYAAKVARAYNEKAAEIEGAKPTTNVYISIWDNEVRWFPSTITGSREQYSIQFDVDGSLKKFEQN